MNLPILENMVDEYVQHYKGFAGLSQDFTNNFKTSAIDYFSKYIGSMQNFFHSKNISCLI